VENHQYPKLERSAARKNVAFIPDPITKVGNIPDLAKKELSNILAKKSVVAEKEKAAERKTSQIVLEVSTPSTAERMQQFSEGNDMGGGVPNTRTDAAVLSTSGIRHAVDPPHGASGEPPNKKKRRAPDITSPHAKGMRTMFPVNSLPVLERRQEKGQQEWMMGYADTNVKPLFAIPKRACKKAHLLCMLGRSLPFGTRRHTLNSIFLLRLKVTVLQRSRSYFRC
jgi:hypothetical protein